MLNKVLQEFLKSAFPLPRNHIFKNLYIAEVAKEKSYRRYDSEIRETAAKLYIFLCKVLLLHSSILHFSSTAKIINSKKIFIFFKIFSGPISTNLVFLLYIHANMAKIGGSKKIAKNFFLGKYRAHFAKMQKQTLLEKIERQVSICCECHPASVISRLQQ